MKKVCSRCNQEKPLEEFSFKNISKGTKNSYCKTCHRDYTRSHYNENKQLYVYRAVQTNKKTKEKIREHIKHIKQESSCEICGESHPATLDFHHIHDDSKDFSVSKNSGKSLSVINKEIDKCIILCSNCHRKLHWSENFLVPK